MDDTIAYAEISYCREMPDPDFALRHWRKVEANNPLVPQRRTGSVL
ncbi:MAG TPA: hypothetical protein VGK06_09500 [Methanosarcina sp.]